MKTLYISYRDTGGRKVTWNVWNEKGGGADRSNGCQKGIIVDTTSQCRSRYDASSKKVTWLCVEKGWDWKVREGDGIRENPDNKNGNNRERSQLGSLQSKESFL